MRALPSFLTARYEDLNFARVTTVRHRGTVVAFAEATKEGDNSPSLWYNALDLNLAETAQDETQDEGDVEQEQPWNDANYWTGFRQVDLPDEVRLVGKSLLTFNATPNPRLPGDTPDSKLPGEWWSVLSDDQ